MWPPTPLNFCTRSRAIFIESYSGANQQLQENSAPPEVGHGSLLPAAGNGPLSSGAGSLNGGSQAWAPAYCISKAADMQLARNLAHEYGPHGVRVNCIAPGLVKTDFARALWENPEVLAQHTVGVPLRRIGEPDEIAGAAVYLAAPASRFMTGQTLVIDGGVTI